MKTCVFVHFSSMFFGYFNAHFFIVHIIKERERNRDRGRERDSCEDKVNYNIFVRNVKKTVKYIATKT